MDWAKFKRSIFSFESNIEGILTCTVKKRKQTIRMRTDRLSTVSVSVVTTRCRYRVGRYPGLLYTCPTCPVVYPHRWYTRPCDIPNPSGVPTLFGIFTTSGIHPGISFWYTCPSGILIPSLHASSGRLIPSAIPHDMPLWYICLPLCISSTRTYPLEGTFDQAYLPPSAEGTWGRACPPTEQNDRHLRKYYLAGTSLAGGKNNGGLCQIDFSGCEMSYTVSSLQWFPERAVSCSLCELF